MSLWGSLLQFRRKFDQYINLRPVRLLPGVPCPLANKQPGDIDMVIVRENTEGEYSSVGGRMFEGTDREFVLQEAIFTRTGVDRVLKFAFELAQKRPKKHLTSATKSNGISISMPYWDERVDAMGSTTRRSGMTSTTSISWPRASCCRRSVSTWWWRPTCSAISCPTWPGMRGHHRHRAVGQPEPGPQVPFAVRAGARLGARYLRPEHRQSDRHDLVRRDDAGLPWPQDAHDAIVSAVERCLVDGPRTPDMGGTADTTQVGSAIAALI
jgi:tartrate dehydrogenase/decarboxylase/D-malate dehydrogenase